LEDLLIRDYKDEGRKSLETIKTRVQHLFGEGSPFDRKTRATAVTTTSIKEYIDYRREKGKSDGTIKKELLALTRMFRLGIRHDPPLIASIPVIPNLKQGDPKKGFLENDDYQSFVALLPDYLKPILVFAYQTGWRKEEILGLTWNRINRKQGTIELERKETKSGEPRKIYMDEIVRSVVKNQFSHQVVGCPFVFNHNGRRIKDLRGAWNKACREAGIGYGYRTGKKYTEKWEKKVLKAGPTIHDLRRTFARNSTRGGMSELVAMAVGGWKTRSVFDRYNITSDRDLQKAAKIMSEVGNGNGDKK
jgi:integrase